MTKHWLAVPFLLVCAAVLRADGPGDNLPDKVRPIPPAGIAVPAPQRETLQAGVRTLNDEIESLRKALAGKSVLFELLPDVEIFAKAVHYALAYNEFYQPRELKTAEALLRQGKERAAQLRAGKAPWALATGLVVRGYRSRIDGSVQPYGLVVPASYQPGRPYRHRLDVWCHGRGEKLTELSFLEQRQRSAGEFTPPHAFVLHPYGRYCNANKFAGEIDVLEALDHVRRNYAIDDNRLVMRGFSMGGAACWQFAVHYPGLWCAAAPGAGFSETAQFLRIFQNEKVQPAWYEQKLWHWYDCTDYAANLFNCPTVAYSGEKDSQKQAADMMEQAMKKVGLSLVHIIGPGMGHRYHPQSKREISARIDAVAARGRLSLPREVRFTTWTLRYNRAAWVQVDGLEKQWDRATVTAVLGPRANPADVAVSTRNVTALTLTVPPGAWPPGLGTHPRVRLDGASVEAAPVLSDRSWAAHFRKENGKWQRVARVDDGTLHKRHGLQGPIDDAFMESFLMVRPTGKPFNDKVGQWADHEMKHAVEHWRLQFRGDARVKDDKAVTDDDIKSHNLVLWGDPSSNKVLAHVLDRLPVKWSPQSVRLGTQSFDAAHHVPVLIFPNPLNPKRYVVLNSGFTYREYDYLNNARQVPKLPDFAVLDVRTPPSSRFPGKVVTAGFFDEQWRLPADKEREPTR